MSGDDESNELWASDASCGAGRQGAAVGLAVEAKQEMGPGTDLDKRESTHEWQMMRQ